MKKYENCPAQGIPPGYGLPDFEFGYQGLPKVISTRKETPGSGSKWFSFKKTNAGSISAKSHSRQI
ncbi:MAG: hypothetical protein CSA19_01005 [Deltaproteobacteria bacterium]|nr:MAG: hypothetical protein CSA19_01005 [Deltaproteobacteria bacterium]